MLLVRFETQARSIAAITLLLSQLRVSLTLPSSRGRLRVPHSTLPFFRVSRNRPLSCPCPCNQSQSSKLSSTAVLSNRSMRWRLETGEDASPDSWNNQARPRQTWPLVFKANPQARRSCNVRGWLRAGTQSCCLGFPRTLRDRVSPSPNSRAADFTASFGDFREALLVHGTIDELVTGDHDRPLDGPRAGPTVAANPVLGTDFVASVKNVRRA
ncbi:hypothetical protein MUK42_22175 [Musa troglodytarum]|uniref:Uncharacterized protein n=1 Tax=Musa troglodytarum TaxID=320322 RepID=A0A9E7GEK5_9LILI|nr:hypothetical protein MUK42_22175 [Musa troglodytarum]